MTALLRRPDLVPSLFSEGSEAPPERRGSASTPLLCLLERRLVLGTIVVILSMPLVHDGLTLAGTAVLR